MIGPKNISLESSFLDDFPKWILPSKNMRVNVGYYTKNKEPIFWFKAYVTMEATRSARA